ncbi:hypothetical protein H4R99_001905 [Coemansia sp. RSA 1722]|nr:hypothetical protein IWW45_003195 [Coemansia sp. RSA 485]KAJ2604274.1 hypothetical protein H4R99_001905 [Coemansia sp. RSA 1722]
MRIRPIATVLALCISSGGLALAGNQQGADAGVKDKCPGYKVEHFGKVKHGFDATLELAGTPCNIYGKDIQSLILSVRFDTKDRLHVHVRDAAGKQYQIPHSIISLDIGAGVNEQGSSLRFSYYHDPKTGFGFEVHRGNDIIFDTTGHPLIFEDQYIEITSSLPQKANIYGIGETPDYFRRDSSNSTKTLWNRDAADPFRENVYGSHSVYMELRQGMFHGAYLHNSHGMDIVLANEAIQYRVLGGTADFYFFAGPSALAVIDQYTELVGRPNRIPYWSLGFHNCRYGYKSVYEVNDVIANYSLANIPLEVAWTDIDYMDKTRDFTFDPVNFPLSEMQKQLETLHNHKQKMVLMTDPAIQHNSSYPTYMHGHDLDVFIKNADGSEYIGQVWPGYTVFPDWFAPNTEKWWHSELKQYFDQLAIDGMWIDMNEASSFCTGSCGSGKPEDEAPVYPWLLGSAEPPHRKINTTDLFLVPPYAIHNPLPEISDKTIETTAVHSNGVIEYHVHNLYGYMESKATRDFLLQRRPDERPFLLSRSTFSGSGALVNHWTGDNAATWQDLHLSIASVFDFGIFGIPMVGADICGFNGNTTEELCARWIELGAFYPFSRDHNAIDMLPQELYRWDSVAEASRRALAVRYSLLPYLYTMYQHSVEVGWPVARPLVFEFPSISAVVDNDRQMLIGDGILISPVLQKGAVSVDAFFPSGRWYDWYTYVEVAGSDANITLDAPLEHVNVHIRGGKIVPIQPSALTTAEAREHDYSLLVATDYHGTASGELYVDDGQTLSSDHRWVQFEYADQVLRIGHRSGGSFVIQQKISRIILLGVPDVGMVFVNNIPAISKISSKNGSIVICDLQVDINNATTISFL